jgi:hypothetical protein
VIEETRSETIQHISSDDGDDIELLEAEEEAAQRAAEAAEARVRVLRARASSSRASSRSAASATSRRASSRSDISSERIAPPARAELNLPPQIPEEVQPANANVEQVLITEAPAPPQLPLAGADAAATGGAHLGSHRPEVPAQLTELYLRAREQVGNMDAARHFWRAREQVHAGDHQPLEEDHGAGVWTPERSTAGTDIQQRVRELEARIKMLQSQRHASALPSPAASFASIQTPVKPPPDGHDPSYELLRRQRDHEHRIEMRQLQIERDAINIATPKMPPVPPPPGLGQRQPPAQQDDDYDGDYEDPDEGDDYENNFEAMRAAAAVGAPPPRPSSSSSSSTSSSSSSSRRKKIKKKLKKKKKKKVTAPYKVKSGDLRLPSWPTMAGFPVWRRTLRQAVISASNRPERARPWIFAVEDDGANMENLACADDDRHRTLDAKLAEALTKILKGEPARKVALAAERAALSREVLGGRQCLLLIYQEFKRTEARTDAAAYSNLEQIRCGNSDQSLEAFLTLWENLLLSFRTQPSPDHLFSVFMSRVKHLPGLATTMAHLKRIPYGHPDKTLTFLKDACNGLIEEMRTERQLAEVAKVYKNGGTDMAMIGMTDEQKKRAPCFSLRDGKTCTAGSSCPYSHDPKVIAQARTDKEKSGKGKGKSKGTGKGKNDGKGSQRTKGVCKFFNSPAGCTLGSRCIYLHERPAMAATQNMNPGKNTDPNKVDEPNKKAEANASAAGPKGGQKK